MTYPFLTPTVALLNFGNFHLTFCNWCNYLPILGLKLIYVNKWDPIFYRSLSAFYRTTKVAAYFNIRQNLRRHTSVVTLTWLSKLNGRLGSYNIQLQFALGSCQHMTNGAHSIICVTTMGHDDVMRDSHRKGPLIQSSHNYFVFILKILLNKH